MCVTSGEAYIANTRTYVHATDIDGEPVHVCGYQNQATTRSGPNCMFLNFPGTDLQLVRGPERTRGFMSDLTRKLPALVPYKGGSRAVSDRSGDVVVEDYGDYTVIKSQGSADILSALTEVPEGRRPQLTGRLSDFVRFYMQVCPNDGFALGCFDGAVRPSHPIVVRYVPRNPDVLTIPGLDGHDGQLPRVNQPMRRDFRVAFGIDGVDLPHVCRYQEGVADKPWAPGSVAGFTDNRPDGLNRDYVVSVDDVRAGLTGHELANRLM